MTKTERKLNTETISFLQLSTAVCGS